MSPSPFSRQGRFHKAWAKAMAEPDPARCLDRLRALWTKFAEKPAAYAPDWPPFLNSVLRGRPDLAPLITAEDLTALEDIGFRLTARPAPGLTQRDALAPLLAARDLRRQAHPAIALLTRMCQAPELPFPERAALARALAARGARGDEQLDLYVRHLHQTGSASAEPAMLSLLAGTLKVDFDADRIRLKRAGELAGKLRAAQLDLAGVDLALGFAYLLLAGDYPVAIQHFQAARAADPASFIALLGLLAAWTHNGDHDLALAAARITDSPVTSELGELCAMLVWLDDARAPGQPPCSLARLGELNVRRLAGDWLDFAIGRAHLLTGNAGQAAEILLPLAQRHPKRPQWNYHAAWALALRGDRDGVRRLFLTRDWPVGCLLLDTDPGLADEIERELKQHGVPTEDAETIRTRLALARRERPDLLTVPLTERPLPEALESLRTMLGQRLVGAPTPFIDDTVRAMVAHLPLADQLLWTGLAALSTDRGRGRAALEQAAHRLGYPRAALVLAVHHLEEGRHGEAEPLLARFDGRTDPDFRVLRAWSRARVDDGATAELDRLATEGNSRAHYALGSVYIGRMTASSADRKQVFAHQAAAEFHAALRDPVQPVPADAAVLARCAELAGTGRAAPIANGDWAAVQTLPMPRRSTWVCWLSALAQLTDDPATADPGAAEHLVAQLEDAGGARAVPRSVAHVLVQASLADADPVRAEVFTGLVGRLARLRSDPELARLHDLLNAATDRLSGHPATDANNSPEARFVAAERALSGDDRTTAARELREVPPGDELVERSSAMLADLLDGNTPQPDVIIEIPDDVPQRTTLALHVVNAAALAESEPDRSVAMLAPVIGESDLAGIVDLRPSLPLLCAGIARNRQKPGPLLELILGLATNPGDGYDDIALLARCAAAIGEHDLAEMLWHESFVRQPQVSDEHRAEYIKFLNHRAVLAHRQDDCMAAVHQLLLARRATTDLGLLQPVPTPDEVDELAARFDKALKQLPEPRRRSSADEWRLTSRQVLHARQARDDTRAMLMFAYLENQLAHAEAGEP
ncbi:MAG TPA: hypothetical protein VJ914_01570 [Pseudonocardiaceae bacterium]|nr:hypothetical protein [Pseudonocardiaceae bacterium]